MTQSLRVGRFASRERLNELRTLNVTDILNVSDTPSQLAREDGPFRSVTWIDIEDGIRIPTDVAIEAIDTIHRSLSCEDGCVYVHCMAGWNRSPTILWLYLIACGISQDEAAICICANALDAVPGHASLIDSVLIEAVRSHGRKNFQPHPRPTVIQPSQKP